MKLPSYIRIRRIRILFEMIEVSLRRHAGDPILDVVVMNLWREILKEVRRG